MALPAAFATLHEESQAFLKAALQRGGKSFEDMDTVKESRESSEATVEYFHSGFKYDFKGERDDVTIPSPHDPAGIPAWVYKPKPCPPDVAIVVFFHGGGWVICSRKTHDPALKLLTDTVGCIFVSVEYRLAPEHKFPAALEDAEVAVRWCMENKEKIGGSVSSKIGVCGDSAGGHLAASAAHDVPGVSFQVLVYPVFDLRCNTASYKLYSDGYSLTEKQMQWYANHFLNNEEEKSDPRASPLLRQSFSHLPPALCIVTGSDVLVDENMEYVQKLKDAGVETELVVMKGVVHSYFVLPAFFRENIAFSYAKVADFIKKHST